MEDAAFLEFCFPGESIADPERLLATFTPEKRATIERMAELVDEIALWQAGVGEKPRDAIICGPKQVRLAYARKDDRP